MVRSSLVRKVADTSSDTTPLPPWQDLFVCGRLIAIRSVRATPKKARDVSPPPQDDLWVQKATANLEKILSNMASQAASTGEATQAALAAILARLEVGPVVPQVVVPNNKDYPPLPPTALTFVKLVLLLGLPLKRETSVPAHSAPKVELSSGLRLIYASGFPYAKPGDLRKAIQGARIRTSAVRDIRWISRQVVQLLVDADYVSAFTRIITSLDATIVKSFKAWIPRPEAADKDKLAAISSFAAKTVTTIQRSPDVKARNFFRSLLASIGGKTLEAATVEATKIRVQTPNFSISTLETVPKESLQSRR
ncbi:hypothetical protein BASA83_008291 [Batrachochytrium salamandrivorans]|nr:hypothetical protein BASA83_008291 [Batrachochytrium salamandrivorans]